MGAFCFPTLQLWRLLLLRLVALPPLAVSIPHPEDFPNLLAGTFTDGQSFSTGNTVPLIARPWGFNHWSFQTNEGKTAWWSKGDDYHFHWLRLTHQPSPWIGDWAWLCFGPQMGPIVGEPVMFFEPWGSRIKPYTFDATLAPDNMRVQLTPTDHGAALKVTFPEANPRNLEKRICFKLPPQDREKQPGQIESSDPEHMWIELTITRVNDVPGKFGLHVRAEVDTASLRHMDEMPHGLKEVRQRDMHCFEFSHKETEVTVWVGSSLISAEQARLNLQREVHGRTFEDVEEESRLVWRELLGRVDVADPGEMTEESFRRLTLFYGGLYRALIFPRRLDEIDADGNRVHYSPYDRKGGVHAGPLVTDNGFWDTFRTVYPLLSLAYPEEAGEIVMGWLNAYREGDWLPEWSSPGYRQCMVGTYASVVVADAILKDLPGVDKALAWDAMHKDSYTAGGRKGQGGKINYAEYQRYGYLPMEVNGDSVSGTLDYAFSDFSVSLAAEKLGKTSEAKELRDRALAARGHMFDKSSGLMRPKSSSGTFRTGDATKWGGGYVEGSAWHHSFPAFDLMGLVNMHGSKDALARKIKEMVETPGTFLAGTYGRTIHEMEEMRAFAMGQYGHNNQPVHHVLWLLSALDENKTECQAGSSRGAFCPRRYGEDAIHKVLEKAYAVDFFAGDEDNGEMGAWYVLSALGLFEPAPGTYHGYALGSPLFRKVDIYRKPRTIGSNDTPAFSIQSNQAGVLGPRHVSRVLLNGEELGSSSGRGGLAWTVSYDKLTAKSPGSVLRFLTEQEQEGDVVAQVAPPPATLSWPKNAASKRGSSSPVHATPMGSRAPTDSRSTEPAPQARQDDTDKRRLTEALDKVREQQSQIVKVEGKLRDDANKINHLESLLKAQRQHTADHDLDFGLASHAQLAFCILISVNVVGWLGCILSRRSAKVATKSSSGNSSKKSKRSNANAADRGTTV